MALHVTNGDMTIPRLRGVPIEDPIIAWRDVLHEGPVPAVADDELRAVREDFLGATGFAARDATLDAAGEWVLWFEADLYDQLQIVQVLARLRDDDPAAITLVCVGEHPGFAPFGGLGQLSSAQLARLRGQTLTTSALEFAVAAWDAFRAPEPSALNAIAAAPHPELRFVAEAFGRLSREYPSTRDGLALSERRLLAAIAAGARTAGDAFVAAAARETRPFLGDTWAFARLTRMEDLVAADGPVDRYTRVALTGAGRAVLAGREQHAPPARWIGGVRVGDHRFDEGTETVVS